MRVSLVVMGRDGNRRLTTARCVSRGWLKEKVSWAGWSRLLALRRGLVRVPGYAAEGMAVPLAVKDLRPQRGAFGVLDRESPARHRQKRGAGRSLPQQTPRNPVPCRDLGTNLGLHAIREWEQTAGRRTSGGARDRP